jgi:hypothetical protein
MSLKTENSRRVAKSRPVCMGLKTERAGNGKKGRRRKETIKRTRKI